MVHRSNVRWFIGLTLGGSTLLTLEKFDTMKNEIAVNVHPISLIMLLMERAHATS